MNLNFISKELRLKRSLIARRKWHKKYAFIPVRINDENVIWLEYYWRKDEEDNMYVSTCEWIYRTNKDHFELTLKGD